MPELHELDALEQAAAVRAGEVGAVELVEHHLERVERLGGRLGAFVTVTAEAAREQARAADERLRSQGAQGLPPLFGVPTAVKDLNPVAGVPVTFGSAVYRGFTPSADAHCARLLRAAGTISLGKTNTPEFGLSAYTDNDLVGPARTPWSPEHNAGGSSGGAAAAVAAGLVPVAHGSDGGGSLRIPASCCGVFGFKPSRGRISNGPQGTDVSGLTCQGPVARSVRDAAALLDAMAGPQTGDPHWAPPLPPGETFLGHAGREPGRLRIAAYCDPVVTGEPAHPEVLAAYRSAAELLAGLGHEVTEIDNPYGDAFKVPFATVWGVQSLIMPVTPERAEELRPLTRLWREQGRATSAERYLGALTALHTGARRALTRLAPYDAVLSPTLGLPPRRHGWFAEEGPREDRSRQLLFSPYTAACNATGQPAASLPLHVTPDGLPVGVMLAGRPAGDAALLALCAQVEAAAPWSSRRPPLA